MLIILINITNLEKKKMGESKAEQQYCLEVECVSLIKYFLYVYEPTAAKKGTASYPCNRTKKTQIYSELQNMFMKIASDLEMGFKKKKLWTGTNFSSWDVIIFVLILNPCKCNTWMGEPYPPLQSS